MEVIERPIAELIFAEYNPRQLSTDQYEHLKASLKRFDCVEPVIVNTHPDRKDIIVGGHQRVRVWNGCTGLELSRCWLTRGPIDTTSLLS